MGFEGRVEEVNGIEAYAIKQQGYILYASDKGDAIRAWGSGINKAMRWGVNTWMFGYSNKRVNDLIEWRENFIEEFEAYKENYLLFCHHMGNHGLVMSVLMILTILMLQT